MFKLIDFSFINLLMGFLFIIFILGMFSWGFSEFPGIMLISIILVIVFGVFKFNAS